MGACLNLVDRRILNLAINARNAMPNVHPNSDGHSFALLTASIKGKRRGAEPKC
jgi:hypothetical protein